MSNKVRSNESHQFVALHESERGIATTIHTVKEDCIISSFPNLSISYSICLDNWKAIIERNSDIVNKISVYNFDSEGR